MNTNERCLYEFKFAFGYITVVDQYEFIKLFDFLLEKKYLSLLSRKQDIIPSFKLKIYYYGINFEDKEKLKYQRFSVYHIDKCVLRNVCKLISTRYDGVYQPNQKNFWNPNLLVFEKFRKNIEEYILFRPQDVLEPVENIEKYIVDKFIEFFRDELMYDRQTVINGGYGIKKILENRYGLFEVIDTKDIDVMVGGCTVDNLQSIMQQWNDKIDRFLQMIGNPNIKKIFKNFKGKFFPQFNYNGYKEITISYLQTDLIDVMFTNYIIKDEIIDKTQSNLPLKKLEYYLEDLLKLVYQTNVDGINHDLYNPIHGTKKDKGKKIIDRAKLLCSILENKPKYKNRCSIIKSITDKDLIKSNDEKIELFSSFAE